LPLLRGSVQGWDEESCTDGDQPLGGEGEFMSFKKDDRVKVRPIGGHFDGQIGTVIAVSRWVFSDPDICYLVDLDKGDSVTCDAQDLDLYLEEKEKS
jgi:hypothetical protein